MEQHPSNCAKVTLRSQSASRDSWEADNSASILEHMVCLIWLLFGSLLMKIP
jgi:hypothetical protein